MDKIMHELRSEVRDRKASILLEKVQKYNVRKRYETNTQFYEHDLHFLNKIPITYKNGINVGEEKVNGIYIMTIFNRKDEEEVFFIQFKTESGKTNDLNFMYASDVDKIINSL